ncbi:hypothetical protein [Cytobacillus sp. NCCP-133]|uniref:hypothetical protein n=1 Tax=Cytobacillus sp. NCCP-133 TaxID=766848 RepID=UPI00222EC1C8|nr:hypothetical protein [Cytobacillus sp. NCCP-133]GLB58690.1 hypothetical protein NCCP133_08230 [Cytobacillus sp. NCCP-133]
MLNRKEKLQLNSKGPAHRLNKKNMGGKPLESLQTEQPVKQIEGKFGAINILVPDREVSATDEDIHSLIARILLMKQKRLATRE